jgi:hypothetical protein
MATNNTTVAPIRTRNPVKADTTHIFSNVAIVLLPMPTSSKVSNFAHLWKWPEHNFSGRLAFPLIEGSVQQHYKICLRLCRSGPRTHASRTRRNVASRSAVHSIWKVENLGDRPGRAMVHGLPVLLDRTRLSSAQNRLAYAGARRTHHHTEDGDESRQGTRSIWGRRYPSRQRRMHH